jgi:flagellar basal-body rod protein FlgB
MERTSLFAGSLVTLEKVLDLRAMRHNLIASNVANIDTPNYKAFDVLVEEEMRRAGDVGHASVQIRQTHSRHILGPEPTGFRANIRQSGIGGSLRNDGNNVDLDTQMTKMSENSLLYNASAQILSKKYQGLKNVIQGGKK